MKKTNLRSLCIIAMIAAVYAAVTLALSAFSFGAIQVRISEALTLLPVLFPNAIAGVSLGCFLANLLGVMMGMDGIGIMDIFFGTAATVLAAITTYKFRNIRFKGLPLLSAFMPVIFNAVIIGFELSFMYQLPFFITAVEVGVGEAISCFVLGIPLAKALEKADIVNKFNL